ncbi:MAG: dephospho-CoA kinase [Clostridia bacterium]|nr:dephospho-CoA kinase [Clostridia bacterium]
MRYVLGLTGGTGAGKSLISAILQKKGAKIIDADKLSREITKEGGIALGEIDKAFPGVIKNGVLDRKALGRIVFSDKEKLLILNEITHKYIIKLTKEEIEASKGLIVLDAPLLFEAGEDKLCDKVIFVDADDEIRLARIMKRDNLSIDDARARINARDLAVIKAKCDFVILNDGDAEKLEKEIADIVSNCDGKDFFDR